MKGCHTMIDKPDKDGNGEVIYSRFFVIPFSRQAGRLPDWQLLKSTKM